MSRESSASAFAVPGRRLARLFAIESSKEGDWGPNEVGSVFRHQWRAPILREPTAQTGRDHPQEMPATTSTGDSPQTLADLLEAPRPSIERLALVKDWAKAQLQSESPAIPREVAYVTYYSCIFAAELRLGRRLTSLDDSALVSAADWVAEQEWADGTVRELARAARSRLASSGNR